VSGSRDLVRQRRLRRAEHAPDRSGRAL